MPCNRLTCSDTAIQCFRLRSGGVHCVIVLLACLLFACAKNEEAASERPAAEVAASAGSPPPVDHGSMTERSHEKMAQDSGEGAASPPTPTEHEPTRAAAKEMAPSPPVGYGSIARKKHAHAKRERASVTAAMARDSTSRLPAFPWPPPKPSARLDISLTALNKATNGERHANPGSPEPRVLGDINAALIAVLEAAGHRERSYFAVPSGFALVTRLEAINADGSAKLGADSLPVGNHFAMPSLLDKLLHVQKGWYRVVAFVVASNPTGASPQPPTEEEANNWLVVGDNALPDSVSRAQVSGHTCSAYIYEFEKSDVSAAAHLMFPSSPDGTSHLTKMGFAEVLQ